MTAVASKIDELATMWSIEGREGAIYSYIRVCNRNHHPMGPEDVVAQANDVHALFRPNRTLTERLQKALGVK